MSEQTQGSSSLQSLFGSFRAEWLQERLYGLFNEPAYFPSLTDHRPCVLLGGRGTGKTTVLRCMAYEGQFALSSNGNLQPLPRFLGMYRKVNTPRVTAFHGSDRSDQDWQRLFAHYINVELCEMLVEALFWHKKRFPIQESLSERSCRRIGASFGFQSIDDESDLRECLDKVRDDIEICVNNSSGELPKLSLLQVPVDLLVKAMREIPFFSKKPFFFILDEYENFLDYQQATVNTLIKHSSGDYVFKLGVRELGWRIKSTLNPNEYLISPADYELIDIDKRLRATFPEFAMQVCETRLAAWHSENNAAEIPLVKLLPSLSQDEEAEHLGVSSSIATFVDFIRAQPNGRELDSRTSSLQKYVFLYLNEGAFDSAYVELNLYAEGDTSKLDRFNNYRYACLFTIANKGSEIAKYYCGVDVFSLICRNNIRFFLQLVNESISLHVATRNLIGSPISFANQTKAARNVGLQYLTELEGVTVKGVQLVKLLLGLGRLFQILSMNPLGSKPECNQFQIRSSDAAAEGATLAATLLRTGVMHLALVRSSGTKLATEADTREWDYAPHPIFAPFFNLSHRRKRKMDLTEQDIAELVSDPTSAIKRLLKSRRNLVNQDLPQQLRLFDNYFAGPHA